MTLDDFKWHVDLYGADLSRWPVDKMKAAQDFMAQTPTAKTYFEEALALEDLLRQAIPASGDIEGTAKKIVDAVLEDVSTPPVTSPVFSRLVWQMCAVFVMVVVSVTVGVMPQ